MNVLMPRPHTAASISKAAANALTLALWEPAQLWLGERLYQQGTRAVNTLMFSH